MSNSWLRGSMMFFEFGARQNQLCCSSTLLFGMHASGPAAYTLLSLTAAMPVPAGFLRPDGGSSCSFGPLGTYAGSTWVAGFQFQLTAVANRSVTDAHGAMDLTEKSSLLSFECDKVGH